MLIVRFIGNVHNSHMLCTYPSELIKGQLYEVYRINSFGGSKTYQLRNIDGEFAAEWFTRIGESFDAPTSQYWARNQIGGELHRIL